MEIVSHWMASGKTKEKSRSTAWKRESSRAMGWRSGRREQRLSADLGEHGGLAQLAALGLGGAEFAEDGDGFSGEQRARAAAGLDPRGE